MGFFNRIESTASEAPASIERISALMGQLNYRIRHSGEDFLNVESPAGEVIIRDLEDCIEILGVFEVPENSSVEPISWVIDYNPRFVAPTMLTFPEESEEGTHLVAGSFRVPTALRLSDQQLLDQLKVGLEAVSEAMHSFDTE